MPATHRIQRHEDIEHLRAGLRPQLQDHTWKMDRRYTRMWEDRQFRAHGIDSFEAEQFLQTTKVYSGAEGLWSLKLKPAAPTAVMYTKLATVMNSVFAFFGIKDRKAVVVANKAVPNDVAGLGTASAKPDIIILGHDASQLPKALSEYDLSPAAAKKDAGLDSLNSRIEHDYNSSLKYYPGCIAAGDIKCAGSESASERRVTLATYAAQTFAHQDNRHFVYTFALTTDGTFNLLLLDRSGAMETKAIDIDLEPELFVMYIALLGGKDLKRTGFDTSVRFVGDKRYITMPGGDEDRFEILDKAAYRGAEVDIYGRGTRCWDAVDRSTGKAVFIKDAWRWSKWIWEGSCLKAAMGVEGVNQAVASHDFSAEEGGSTAAFRGKFSPQKSDPHFPFATYDFAFSRLVLVKEGKVIWDFETRVQMLKVYRGSIVGHQNLVKAGVLHRDVSFNNIMSTADGQSGILIDLDNARLLQEADTITETGSPRGTFAFQSIYLLRQESNFAAHCFIDDLESFIYVLNAVLTRIAGPGGMKKVPDSSLYKNWKSAGGLESKILFLEGGDSAHQCDPADYFRFPPFVRLVANLCNLVRPYAEAKERLRQSSKKSLPIPLTDDQRDEVYSNFIAHVDKAIQEITDYDFTRVYTDAELDMVRHRPWGQFKGRATKKQPTRVQPKRQASVKAVVATEDPKSRVRAKSTKQQVVVGKRKHREDSYATEAQDYQAAKRKWREWSYSPEV